MPPFLTTPAERDAAGLTGAERTLGALGHRRNYRFRHPSLEPLAPAHHELIAMLIYTRARHLRAPHNLCPIRQHDAAAATFARCASMSQYYHNACVDELWQNPHLLLQPGAAAQVAIPVDTPSPSPPPPPASSSSSSQEATLAAPVPGADPGYPLLLGTPEPWPQVTVTGSYVEGVLLGGVDMLTIPELEDAVRRLNEAIGQVHGFQVQMGDAVPLAPV